VRGRWLAAALVVALPAALASCGSATSGGGQLLLYNGQHLETTAALVAAFEERTGIKVAVRTSDEAVLANQLIEEGSRSPADVFYTENSPALETVAAHGLLAPVDSTTLTQVPAAASSPKGLWVGVTKRVTVMAYSTSLLKASELPSSVLDLAKPEWRGKIGIAPTETDFQPVVTSVDNAIGEAATVKWLDGLKANAGSHIYPDNESLLQAINTGQVELGVIEQYYWYRLRAEIGKGAMHSSIATFAVGDPGYLATISGAGILASSHDKAAAQKFVAFLVSAQGQEIIAHSDSFEYPLVAGASTPPGEPPISTFHPTPLSVASLGTGATALRLLQEAQLL
jgi:iron(III) transport system substrate-binding protein